MVREERLDKLEEFINAHHYVTVDTIVERFGKSKPTVRRDLNELAAQRRIDLVRGGAMQLNEKIAEDLPFTVPRDDNTDMMEERRRIAEAAAKCIHPWDTIFLCSGRTTREMCTYLKDINPLNVVTNDFFIASELYNTSDINIMLCGGNVRSNRSTPYCCGYAAEDFVKGLRIDKLFLSCDSIQLDSGCYIYNPDEIGLMRAVFKVSQRHIIMATHEKFNQNAFVSICKINAIDLLITDAGVPEDIRQHMDALGIERMLV